MGSDGTLFVVDDDPAVRKSLRRLAESVSLPVREFATATEFLDSYDPAEPGCLVLDVRMPGISGMELQKRLVADGIEIPVIMLTGHGDIPMAAEAMRRGAIDFLEKPIAPQQLLDRIQQAMAQDAKRRREKAERDEIAARVARLTRREREVVDLVVTGLTNKGIAAQFGVSPQAIDAHRTRAMDKMHAGSVPELIRLMIKAGAT